jgi:uncharacterized protein YndB with AHSA1/START domain
MTVTDTTDVVQEIVIRAPATRVFAALTDPDQRTRWWGIEGRFHATQAESDLRPGGRWLMRGTAFGGRAFTVDGEYRVVDPPRVLAFTWNPDWDPDAAGSLVRFELTERDGVTTLRLVHSGLSGTSRERHQGWPQLVGLLKAHVEAAIRHAP